MNFDISIPSAKINFTPAEILSTKQALGQASFRVFKSVTDTGSWAWSATASLPGAVWHAPSTLQSKATAANDLLTPYQRSFLQYVPSAPLRNLATIAAVSATAGQAQPNPATEAATIMDEAAPQPTLTLEEARNNTKEAFTHFQGTVSRYVTHLAFNALVGKKLPSFHQINESVKDSTNLTNDFKIAIKASIRNNESIGWFKRWVFGSDLVINFLSNLCDKKLGTAITKIQGFLQGLTNIRDVDLLKKVNSILTNIKTRDDLQSTEFDLSQALEGLGARIVHEFISENSFIKWIANRLLKNNSSAVANIITGFLPQKGVATITELSVYKGIRSSLEAYHKTLETAPKKQARSLPAEEIEPLPIPQELSEEIQLFLEHFNGFDHLLTPESSAPERFLHNSAKQLLEQHKDKLIPPVANIFRSLSTPVTLETILANALNSTSQALEGPVVPALSLEELEEETAIEKNLIQETTPKLINALLDQTSANAKKPVDLAADLNKVVPLRTIRMTFAHLETAENSQDRVKYATDLYSQVQASKEKLSKLNQEDNLSKLGTLNRPLYFEQLKKIESRLKALEIYSQKIVDAEVLTSLPISQQPAQFASKIEELINALSFAAPNDPSVNRIRNSFRASFTAALPQIQKLSNGTKISFALGNCLVKNSREELALLLAELKEETEKHDDLLTKKSTFFTTFPLLIGEKSTLNTLLMTPIYGKTVDLTTATGVPLAMEALKKMNLSLSNRANQLIDLAVHPAIYNGAASVLAREISAAL